MSSSSFLFISFHSRSNGKFVSHLSAEGLSAASLFHFLRATKITFLGKSYFSGKLLSTLFSKYISVTRTPVEPKIKNYGQDWISKIKADSKILKYKILDGLEGLKSRSESKQTCTYIENRIPLMKAFRLAGRQNQSNPF